jgi:hypothetical protein
VARPTSYTMVTFFFLGGGGNRVNNPPNLASRLKKEYRNTLAPAVCLHGMLRCKLYLLVTEKFVNFDRKYKSVGEFMCFKIFDL